MINWQLSAACFHELVDGFLPQNFPACSSVQRLLALHIVVFYMHGVNVGSHKG
jgi:hypothetical protein